MAEIKEVLKEALKEAKPPETEVKYSVEKVNGFLKELEGILKALKIRAEVFVGGSFAKKTLIKKEKYDVDIFVRFDQKYSGENISELTQTALGKTRLGKKAETIHGSRDYFKIDAEPWLCFEIVPTIKVSKPKDAENITDLSYYHVNYVRRKIKNKLVDDIILAKSFCHANRVYGAESHIKGFSGYSLELLVFYYKSFIGFLKEISKPSREKIIIDIEKSYPNKNQVLMDMNSSKLESPVILVDPTFKQRNALATLSAEVFKRFQERCREFLRSPSIEFFRLKEIDFRKMEDSAKKKGDDALLVRISTEKQEGAIAGSKLLKFHNHLASQMQRYFDIKEKVFNYKNEKDADCFFAVKRKEKIILNGPPVKIEKEARKFKSKHRKTFVKAGIIYAEEKINFSLKEFIKDWKNKNRKRIKQMYISKIEMLR